MDGIDITLISWTRGSYSRIGSSIVKASKQAAEHVVDEQIYRRNVTGRGDARVLRHNGIPTVEFGHRTQTAHVTNEFTTTEALTWNVVSYGTIPELYTQLSNA